MKQLAKDQRGFMEGRMGISFEQSKKKSNNFAYGQKIFGAVLQQVHFRRSC